MLLLCKIINSFIILIILITKPQYLLYKSFNSIFDIAKWFTVYPHEDKQEVLPDSEWALHCNICYPTCKDTGYDVLSSKSYMSTGEYKTDLL